MMSLTLSSLAMSLLYLMFCRLVKLAAIGTFAVVVMLSRIVELVIV